MKSILLCGASLLAMAPGLAAPERDRDEPDGTTGSVSVMPISVDDAEPRGAMRLRDALRQPFGDSIDGAKPYRMSVEQRQRLREQLRDHSYDIEDRKPKR